MRMLSLLATLVIAAMMSPAIAVPASAAPPAAVEGYVWANQPSTPQYVADPDYAYTSTGQPITIFRSGPGRYRVQFGGLGVSAGVGHATPSGILGNKHICTVRGWVVYGSDLLLYVQCFDANGMPADTRFVANYTARKATGAEFLTYFRSHEVTDVFQVPPAPFRYDSYGQLPQLVRAGVGRYVVYDDSFDAASPNVIAGHLQVTAFGYQPVRCWWGDEATEGTNPFAYYVYCADENGAPVDSRFTYTWVRGGNILGGTPAAYGNANFGPQAGLIAYSGTTGQPTAWKFAVGRYRVWFPGVGVPHGHAIATAIAHPLGACHVVSWSPYAGGEFVVVDCFHIVSKQPMDMHFGVAFTA